MRYSISTLLSSDDEKDELFDKAVESVIQYDQASPTHLHGRLAIGYARAARLLDQLEEAGDVGPPGK